MESDDEFEDLDVKSVDDLTPVDWAEIGYIADKMFESKIHGQSRTKCAVHAFIKWMSCKDFVVGCDEGPRLNTHH